MKRVIYSGAGLLLIALAFLLFNGLTGTLLTNARLDLTEQKLYTISEGTERILEGLQSPIELHFFYSDETAKDLVALRNYARRVEEMLRAYQRASGGKPAARDRSAAVLRGRRPRRRVRPAGGTAQPGR